MYAHIRDLGALLSEAGELVHSDDAAGDSDYDSGKDYPQQELGDSHKGHADNLAEHKFSRLDR